jgi:hypothetical protein
MKTSETLNSPPPPPVAGDATENPTPTTPSAVPQAKPSSTEVLITEQQVMFGTAAAVASRRPENRLMAALGRIFATSTTETRPRRQHSVPRRMYYIESARMGREMDRL